MGSRKVTRGKSDGAKAFCKAIDALREKSGVGATQPCEAVERIREACGVSKHSWWAYRQGARRPNERTRRALHKLLGIAPQLWMTPEERATEKARERAVKRAAA